MAQTSSNNRNYLIVQTAISIQPNALNNDPQFCVVGTAIGAAIRMIDVWGDKTFDGRTINIGLSAGTTYKKWNLVGAQYHLPTSTTEADCYLYVRVPQQEGESADFGFTTLDLDIIGQYKTKDADGKDTLASVGEGIYYVKLCKLNYNSATKTRSVEDLDCGNLGTDKWIVQATSNNDLFEEKDGAINPKKPFSSIIINTSLKLAGTLVTGIRNLAAGIENWASDDSRLATCANIAAYVASKLDDLNNKYLRKDIDDTTTHKLTIGTAEFGVYDADEDTWKDGDITAHGNATVHGKVVTDTIKGRTSTFTDGADAAHPMTKVEDVLDIVYAAIADRIQAHGTGDLMLNTHIMTNQQGGIKHKDFIPDIITGQKWQIDKNGDAEMRSLILRSFLEVPELRYNRITVESGTTWNCAGAGIIRKVGHDTNGTYIDLKLEDGEIGSFVEGDICMGIWHFENEPIENVDGTTHNYYEDNATKEDEDNDPTGITVSGFCRVNFKVKADEGSFKAITDYYYDADSDTHYDAQKWKNEDGIESDVEVEGWTEKYQKCQNGRVYIEYAPDHKGTVMPQMVIVGYGNYITELATSANSDIDEFPVTNSSQGSARYVSKYKARTRSWYATKSFQRYLINMNGGTQKWDSDTHAYASYKDTMWDIAFPQNIGMHIGDTTDMSVTTDDGSIHNLEDYSVFLSNVYFYGKMENLKIDTSMLTDSEGLLKNKNYVVDLTSQVNSINIKTKTNAQGSTIVDPACLVKDGMYILNTAVSVRNGGTAMTVNENNEPDKSINDITLAENEFAFSITAHNCSYSCAKGSANIFITGIDAAALNGNECYIKLSVVPYGKQISIDKYFNIRLVYDGEDGKDIEFVFLRTKVENTPSCIYKTTGNNALAFEYQEADFLPFISQAAADAYANATAEQKEAGQMTLEGESVNISDYQWTDDALGLDDSGVYLCEYMAKRTKKDGVWGDFTDPVLWVRRGADGSGIFADNDNENVNIGCSTDGVVKDAYDKTWDAYILDGASLLNLTSANIEGYADVAVAGTPRTYQIKDGTTTLITATLTIATNKVQVRIQVASGVTLPNNCITLPIHMVSANGIERTSSINVNGLRTGGDAIEINVSSHSIHADANGIPVQYKDANGALKTPVLNAYITKTSGSKSSNIKLNNGTYFLYAYCLYRDDSKTIAYNLVKCAGDTTIAKVDNLQEYSSIEFYLLTGSNADKLTADAVNNGTIINGTFTTFRAAFLAGTTYEGVTVVDSETIRYVNSGTTAITSFIFRRSATVLTSADRPIGGTFLSPLPTKMNSDNEEVTDTDWHDTIPAEPQGEVYMSKCTFYSDNSGNPTWSVPAKMTDSADFDVEFSKIEKNPGNPTDNAANWGDDDAHKNDAVWMATRNFSNGEWSSWTISKIKGEDAVSYRIILNASQIHLDENGRVKTPASLTYSVVKYEGGTPKTPVASEVKFYINNVEQSDLSGSITDLTRSAGVTSHVFTLKDSTGSITLDEHTVQYVMDGASASGYVVDLNNEMSSVPCDKEYKITKETTLDVKAWFYFGADNLGSTASVSTIGYGVTVKELQADGTTYGAFRNDTPLVHNLRFTIAKGDYTLPSPLEIPITLTAVHDGKNVTKEAVFTIMPVTPGADGASPVIYELQSSYDSIKVNNLGVRTPKNYISVKVNKTVGEVSELLSLSNQRIDGDKYIFYSIDGSTTWTKLTMSTFNVSSANTNVRLRIQSNDTDTAEVTASDTKIYDRETIPVIKDGQGVFNIDLTNEGDTLFIGTDNSLDADTPFTTTLNLYNGGTLVTEDVTYGYEDSLPANVQVTNSGSTFTITAKKGLDSGSRAITLTATHNSIVYKAKYHLNTLASGVDGTSYQIKTNYNSITKNKDGYASLTDLEITIVKSANGLTNIKTTTELTKENLSLLIKKDGANISSSLTTNLKVPANDIKGETSITIALYHNSTTEVDTETIPIIYSGSDGDTPYVGENGNWWINGSDTNVIAEGSNGDTPYIGENGNWWIGSDDTYIKAEGTDGKSSAQPNLLDGSKAYREDSKYTHNILKTNGDDYAYLNDLTVALDGTSKDMVLSVCTDCEIATSHNASNIGKVTIWLQFFKSDNTTNQHICFHALHAGYSSLGNNRHSWVFTAPKNYVKAIIRINNYSNGTTPQTSHWWNFKLEEGTEATPWCLSENDKIGPAGEQGTTPHIGANGNWWIGTTDTGTQAQGAEGIGADGAILRPRGTYNADANYFRDETWVDVVRYSDAYGTCKWVLADGIKAWTKNNFTKEDGTVIASSIVPNNNASAVYYPNSSAVDKVKVWDKITYAGDVSYGIVLADHVQADSTTAAEGFIGEFSNDVTQDANGNVHVGSNANGWLIKSGNIRHTKTGLELTKDGKLSIPNGTMSFKVGDSNYSDIDDFIKNKNLFKYGSFQNQGFDLDEPFNSTVIDATLTYTKATSSDNVPAACYADHIYKVQINENPNEVNVGTNNASAKLNLSLKQYWDNNNLANSNSEKYASVKASRIKLEANTDYVFSVWVYCSDWNKLTSKENQKIFATVRISNEAYNNYVDFYTDTFGKSGNGWKQVYFKFNTKTTQYTDSKGNKYTLNNVYLYFNWLFIVQVGAYTDAYSVSHGYSNFYVKYAGAKLEKGTTPTDIKNSLLDTGIDIEERKIKLTADQLECYNNSGTKTMWLNQYGDLALKGVLSNLEQEVTATDQRLIIDADTDDSENVVKGVVVDKILLNDTSYRSLDVLNCGGVLKISSCSGKVQLPYFFSGNNYTRTLTVVDGVKRLITADEMKSLVGKRIVVIMNMTGTTDRALHHIDAGPFVTCSDTGAVELREQYLNGTNRITSFTTNSSNHTKYSFKKGTILVLECAIGHYVQGSSTTDVYYWKQDVIDTASDAISTQWT